MPAINCLTCGYHQSERVPATLVGKKIKCPQCRRVVTVQTNESMDAIDFPMDDDKPTPAPKVKLTAPPQRTKPSVFRPVSTTPNLPDSNGKNAPTLPPTLIFSERVTANSGKAIRRRTRGLIVPIVLAIATVATVYGTLNWEYLLLVASKDGQPPAAPQRPAKIAADTGLKQLRAYLKENTNTGDWEEVRFWPAFSLSTEAHGEVVKAAGLLLTRNTKLNDYYSEAIQLSLLFRADQNLRFMRLKYRTQSGFGSLVIVDTIFFINGDKVSPLSRSEQQIMQWAWDGLEQVEAARVRQP